MGKRNSVASVHRRTLVIRRLHS